MRIPVNMTRDDGFSLSELMIALVLGLMLLGIVYLVLETGLGNYDRLEVHNQASRDGGRATEITMRYVREVQNIVYAGDARLDIEADWDDDGVSEAIRFIYTASAGGGTYYIVRADTSDGIDAATGVSIASYVRNTVSEPVFTYYEYDNTGALIDLTGESETGDRLSADVIRFQLLLDVDTSDSVGVHSVDVEIYLRNDPS